MFFCVVRILDDVQYAVRRALNLGPSGVRSHRTIHPLNQCLARPYKRYRYGALPMVVRLNAHYTFVCILTPEMADHGQTVAACEVQYTGPIKENVNILLFNYKIFELKTC